MIACHRCGEQLRGRDAIDRVQCDGHDYHRRCAPENAWLYFHLTDTAMKRIVWMIAFAAIFVLYIYMMIRQHEIGLRR